MANRGNYPVGQYRSNTLNEYLYPERYRNYPPSDFPVDSSPPGPSRTPQTYTHPLSRQDWARLPKGNPVAKKLMKKGLLRIAGRFVPVLNWYLNARDLIDLYNWWTDGYTGWDEGTCAGANFTALAGPKGPTPDGFCNAPQRFYSCPPTPNMTYGAIVDATNTMGLLYKFSNCSFGTEGWKRKRVFTRQTGVPKVNPTWQPQARFIPKPRPDLEPEPVRPAPRTPVVIDPEELPPLAPQPDPMPKPWLIIPEVIPSSYPGDSRYGTVHGYGSSRNYGGWGVVTITVKPPVVVPDPTPPKPDPDVPKPPKPPKPKPKPRTWLPSVRQSTYTPRPPPRGTKERKVIANVAGRSLAGIAISSVTEYMDLVNSLYSALPKWAKPYGRASFEEKLHALYKNWSAVNLGKALRAYQENQLEDLLYGSLGRLGAAGLRNNPYYARPVGVQTGPFGEPVKDTIQPYDPVGTALGWIGL